MNEWLNGSFRTTRELLQNDKVGIELKNDQKKTKLGQTVSNALNESY